MIGMAATGAAQISSDRANVRAWTVPVLVSSAVYCANTGGLMGWFGFISIMGFMVILWLEATRGHRRISEMLRLRFESEELAKARALALQEAESLSEAKSRFLATMSHEMRTPLHGILGLSRMLTTQRLDEPGQHHLKLLHGTGEHLLSIINDVLDFSKLRAKHLHIHPEVTDVGDLAQRVCHLMEANAHDKPIAVQWDERGRLWVAESPEYPNGRRPLTAESWREGGVLVRADNRGVDEQLFQVSIIANYPIKFS